jgi:hypothetical protein
MECPAPSVRRAGPGCCRATTCTPGSARRQPPAHREVAAAGNGVDASRLRFVAAGQRCFADSNVEPPRSLRPGASFQPPVSGSGSAPATMCTPACPTPAGFRERARLPDYLTLGMEFPDKCARSERPISSTLLPPHAGSQPPCLPGMTQVELRGGRLAPSRATRPYGRAVSQTCPRRQAPAPRSASSDPGMDAAGRRRAALTPRSSLQRWWADGRGDNWTGRNRLSCGQPVWVS